MKENRANDLIERYLYDVVRRLPEKQRKDIEQELKTLIEDMVTERTESGAGDYETCVEAVLNDLGSPAKLARSYRGERDGLISGEYYDSYCYILKTVLICAGAGMLVSSIISAIVHVVETEEIYAIWNDMVNIGTIPMVLFQAFGIVTLIYAIMERNQVKVGVNETSWSLDKLPLIPYKKAVIRRGESAVGIVFGILFAIMIAFAPQLMGAWFQQGDAMVSIPVFNLSIWNQVMPLFVLSIIAGLVDDFAKLIVGKYNYLVMSVTIISGTVSFVLTCIILKAFPVFNPNFIPELMAVTGRTYLAKSDMLAYFNTDIFANGVIILFLVILLIDIGTTVYYTVRYGNK